MAARKTHRMKDAAAWLSRHLGGGGKPVPAEVALERLAYAERYRRPESSSLYCGVIATVVRSYIEDQFRIRARALTTAEFLAALRDNAPTALSENRRGLERVLACCDIAQTDRYELSDRELGSAHAAAVDLIEATRHWVPASGGGAYVPVSSSSRRPASRALRTRSTRTPGA